MRFFAIIFFFLTLPFFIGIYLIIYFNSGFPVFFKQKRIGKDKNTFTIYKFRTMKNNRITKEGKLIRKTGLDELPQLLNIIKGEMSFVGPRPLTDYDVNRLGWNIPKYEKRWSVKPGITGTAQLLKTCNADLSIKNDLDYVLNKSFLLDVKIILKSTLVPFLGKITK